MKFFPNFFYGLVGAGVVAMLSINIETFCAVDMAEKRLTFEKRDPRTRKITKNSKKMKTVQCLGQNSRSFWKIWSTLN